MDKNPYSLLEQVSQLNLKNRRKKRWQRVVTYMAALVVFCTTYALILPAITMDSALICDRTAHKHIDECYRTTVTQVCTPVHVHDDSCLDENGNRICGKADFVIHSHGIHCYDKNGKLVCTLPKIEPHTHDESCKQIHQHTESCFKSQQGELICTQNTETVHEHIESCYETVVKYICGLEERPAHAHSDACYTAQQTLTCTEPEQAGHTHGEACYGTTQELTCGQEVTEGHTHSDACYTAQQTLTCTEPEQAGHTHGEACYGTTQELTCGQEVTEGHAHSDACRNEEQKLVCTLSTEPHVHGEECYSWTEELVCTESTDAATAPLVCGKDEVIVHTHGEGCYDANHSLICALPEIEVHVHTEECMHSETTQVCTFEEHEHTADCYGSSITLFPASSEDETYTAGFVSDTPTVVQSAHTNDFIELNLYDYNNYINDHWRSNSQYPGFQWNGGAYAYYGNDHSDADDGIPDYTTNRHYLDSIDFGSLVITDFDYQTPAGSPYGKSAASVNVGKLYNHPEAKTTGMINWLWYDGNDPRSTGNRPAGTSTGYQSLFNTLVNGYPALKDGKTSLDYLFTASNAVEKKNTASIDGLFQLNPTSGAFYYNSRWNHAQYNDNKFTLYDEVLTPNFISYPFGNFLPLNSISNSADATQVYAFDRTGGMKAYVEQIIHDLQAQINASDDNAFHNAARRQLITMLQEYRENWKLSPSTINGSLIQWDDLSASNAIRDYFFGGIDGKGDMPSNADDFITEAFMKDLYNIDWDAAANFFFGMEMKMTFMQPKDGLTGKDNGNNTSGEWTQTKSTKPGEEGTYYLTGAPDGISDYPAVFCFTGDDDVWVYIDDVLFLDLTGIHRHAGGRIDFQKGQVSYYELDVEDGGDVSQTPYATYTFKEILEAAGKSADVLNDRGTFKDYSTHQFNFYYLERGADSSVCNMNFNLPLLKKNTLSVSKELSSDGTAPQQGNPDFNFRVLKEGAAANTSSPEDLFIGAKCEYTVYDVNNKVVKTAVTDENGIFTLKDGQRAEFSGIAPNAGSYYVQELLDADEIAQYSAVSVNGVNATISEDVVIAGDSLAAVNSPVWSASDGAAAFRFTNKIAVNQLGTLRVAKKLHNSLAGADSNRNFEFIVRLDGELLPAGTTYKVIDAAGNETQKTVAADAGGKTTGKIVVPAGSAAVIENILANTDFEVSETTDSASGATVTYSGSDVDTEGSSARGVIKAGTNAEITVTHTENAAAVIIPVIGTIRNPIPSLTHEFQFQLTEVTDSTGTTAVSGGTEQTLVLKDFSDTKEGAFTLSYLETGMSLPATYYYKVTEVSDDRKVYFDETVYVYQVNVSKENETFTATVEKIWKNGAEIQAVTSMDDGTTKISPAEFKNTLLGDLTLEKLLIGTTSTEGISFDFTIDAAQLAGNVFNGTKTASDGTQTSVTVAFDDAGNTKVQLQHNEKIIIAGIPLGTNLTVTETDADGYYVRWSNDGEGYKLATDVTLTEDMTLTCTNAVVYELPSTGGFGITPYTVGGLLLMTAALLLLMYTNIKRRKEDTASF